MNEPNTHTKPRRLIDLFLGVLIVGLFIFVWPWLIYLIKPELF